MTYKLGSLFDGSGGFPLAGSLCGIEPVWASEVEPYPIAVTRSRFPKMKHLGDISKINGAMVEPVDIITFGSPCQDLSVAGKRAGLKHEANGDDETTRSGLFMEAVRIIKEMRRATNGKYPTFALWENVPGAFSSNKGEDFRIVCEELIKIVEPTASMPAVPKNGWPYADSYCGNGWSLAYRVFDAQYWGVPQRRRRIHLVVDFRGECAREVLFEREGVRGYFAEGRTPWQSLASDAQNCSGADDRAGDRASEENGVGSGGLPTGGGASGGDGRLDAVGADIYNLATTGNVVGSLTAGGYGSTGTSPKVLIPYTMKIHSGCEGGGKGALVQEDKSATLATNNDQYLFRPVPNLLLDDQGGQQINVRTDEKCPTLRAEAHGNQPAVVFALDQQGGKGGANYAENVMPTLCSDSHGTPHAVAYPEAVGFLRQLGGVEAQTEVSPTLMAAAGMSGNNKPCVAYSFDSLASNSMKSKNPHSGCRQVEVAKTLDTTDPSPNKNQGGIAVVEQHLFENHSQDTRYKGPLDISPMLPAQLGTGGNNTPFVVERREPVVFDGANVTSPINASNPQPGDPCHTLSTDSRNFLVTEEPVYCLQGNGIDRADTAGCNGKGWKEDSNYTLNTIDRPAVAYGVETFHCTAEEEKVPTLKARDWKDPHVVAVNYIVRRLTPTECARLQGFADRWGDIEEKDTFTPEEFSFWHDVRNTHAAINGKKVQEYTEKQMLTWYNKLHTDSAEYKMWGNGIALPPALYCLQGMRDTLDKQTDAPIETKPVATEKETKEAWGKLSKNHKELSRQQFKSIKGQIKAGDPVGALRGLAKILGRKKVN